MKIAKIMSDCHCDRNNCFNFDEHNLFQEVIDQFIHLTHRAYLCTKSNSSFDYSLPFFSFKLHRQKSQVFESSWFVVKFRHSKNTRETHHRHQTWAKPLPYLWFVDVVQHHHLRYHRRFKTRQPWIMSHIFWSHNTS